METIYTATVNVNGGRDGHAKSSDGIFETSLRKPKEMGGQGGATNPEQLFAAAWGSCYLGALQAVAEPEGIDTSNAIINVHISFNKLGKSFVLSADLDVHIPGIDMVEAQSLVDKAHAVCPYSKATKGNIATRATAV
ncbi:organic hydroperoxide resistance protein [Pedobacter sp.]